MAISVGAQDIVRSPRIGLVLSGGGAKGFAHVGALKVIEDAGIPVDYITGTSIGSIVGGLYAIGYDATTLKEIIGNQDWEALLSNEPRRKLIPVITKGDQSRYLLSLPVRSNMISIPEGVLNGQNTMDLLTYLCYGYHDQMNFSNLPIPFKCIAADIATGEEVVLDRGFLPGAIRASMSVPAVFSACEIDNRMLVDGGIVNNFPVDRCREMGADIIIGIDIGDELLPKDKLQSIPDMISQLTTLLSVERSRKNSSDVDILIRPDITGYSASSFSTDAARALMQRGEEAAMKVLPALKKLRDSISVARPEQQHRTIPDMNTQVFVSNIEVEGTEKSNIVSILGKMGIDRDKKSTLHEIREGIAKIYATGNYKSIDYQITGEERKIVRIIVRENTSNRLNIGLNYNTDLKAAALINMTFYGDRVSGSNLSLDAKLSATPLFRARYSLDRGSKPGFTGSAGYITDQWFGYKNNEKVSEINVQQTSLMAGTQAIVSDILRLSAGATFEYYHFGSVLGAIDSTLVADDSFLNYFASATLDELDNSNFPERGWTMNGILKVVTDNGWSYKGEAPLAYLGISVRGAKKISGRVALLPSFNSLFTFAKPGPVFFKPLLGGFQKTNYFGNYIPFAGLRRMEMNTDNAATIGLDLRIRMWQKIYTTFISNFGIIYSLGTDKKTSTGIAGGGISIAYDSVVGPVELIFSTSNLNKKITPYFSLGYYF